MIKRRTPQMAECEIEIFDSIFETQRPARVLEWGSGGSTIYWPPRYDFIEVWVSIEHEPEYRDWVASQMCDKVELRLREPEAEHYVYRLLEGEDEPFDLIIVDGACRIECLIAAQGLLADEGIVVLHDSGRLAYKPGWEDWPRHEVLYAGELPDPERGFLHRGVAVFWQDAYVERKGWCRDYLV